jgi:glutathione synthase/RimK-type ligase-like ATP-grasp enzyme
VLTPYISNVILEDSLLQAALEKIGLRVARKSWDDVEFDWSSTKFALFRTTWDYFNRFAEFEIWLKKAAAQCTLIHDAELVYWNLDKHYLGDLKSQGINIAPTYFVEPGYADSLQNFIKDINFNEYILKPAIAGTARHTYKFKAEEANKHETIFAELLQNESLLVQEYQHQITTKGEISLVLFGGKFSHAVLKTAKPGDFRVQDDFGGTVHDYKPKPDEIAFAEKAIQACEPFKPIYARVDIFWDNQDQLCLAELEMIEPELWFRKDEHAAGRFAEVLKARMNAY